MGRMSFFVQVGLALLALWLGANTAMGAGFALYEGSARGNALGGGLVGRADDPSGLFYNPAGITRLPGVQVMSGATGIVPTSDVVTTRGGKQTRSETEHDVWIAPHLYASCQFSDSVWYGLGVFCPFGLGTAYDPNWPGRYNTYKAVVRTFAVNPNVAFKASEKLSLAFGISWMWFDLALEQKIDFSNLLTPDPDTYVTDIDQALAGDSCGLGFNVALQYDACDWMALGIAYRSPVTQEMEGHVDFTKPPTVHAAFPTVFNDTTAWGEITLPDMVFLAMVVRPFARWSVELGGIWTGWSTYEQLTIHYGKPILDPIQPGVTSTTGKANWNDVWRFHVGTEYAVCEWLDLRTGYVLDVSPVPADTANYLIPANDRHLFSFGCGLHRGWWTVDLSYGYLHVKSRAVSPRPAVGVFDSRFEGGRAHLIGLSVGYGF